MVSRMPDGSFPRSPGNSGEFGAGESPRPDDAPRRHPRGSGEAAPGFAVPAVVAMSLLSALGGFALGNVIWFNLGEPPLVTQGVATPSDPDETAPPDVTAPFSGTVAGRQAITVVSSCEEGSDPGWLIDGDLASVWRCPGDGLGETLQFTVDDSRPVVGVRLVNGNISADGTYLAERRILTLRWTMPDGSRFEYGLSGNNPLPQEVRFPPTTTGVMGLTIVASTLPGDASPESDAVSVAGVEFLYPAQ